MNSADHIRKIFAGIEQPFLPWVCQHLSNRYESSRMIDMGSALVVLPGGNAMRRLMVLLVFEAEQRGKILVPPEMLTTGALVDRLLPANELHATEVARALAWVEALRQIPADQISVLVSEMPARDNTRALLALAERIDALHLEVSGAGLTFSDVALRGAELASFLDEERWQVLEQLSISYQELLAGQGLACRYLDRTARLMAQQEIPVSGELYLAGLVDLNQNVRELLARCTGDLTALVFASQEVGLGIDQFGALSTEYWHDREIPLSHQQLKVVESPRDVTGALYGMLGELSDRYAANDITIGVGDEKQIPYLRGSLNDLGISARSAQGAPFAETETGFFLAAVTRYLSTRTYQHFAALIRHPFFSAWLTLRADQHSLPVSEIVQTIDRYQERHFQAIISEELPRDQKGDERAAAVVEQLHVLLLPLLGAPQAPSYWAEQIVSLIEQVAPAIRCRDQELLEPITEILQEFADSQSPVEMKGADALELFFRQLERRAQLADHREQGIELLGWLELAFDDAPALLLSSLDEGTVPAVINADPFLPNSLRSHLGLTDNARRLARDKYLLTTMLASKQFCSCVVTRRTLGGDASFPSRLLLACPAETLPDRIDLLYQEGRQYHIEREHSTGSIDTFLLKKPELLPDPLESMTVTSFRDYMDCPYRFYLKHIAQLRSCNDDLVELDELNFGTLAHQVLYLAGQERATIHCYEPEKIFQLFDGILAGLVQARYGTHEFPAIRVQVEQLRERLRHFSRWQAHHAREGWKIHALEIDIPSDKCFLKLEEGSMGVRGRIDRIDFHEPSNQYLVFDYKTGEKGRGQSNVYSAKSGWSDLQMPLYYHAARTFIPDAPIEFAYVNLSARITDEQVAYIPVQGKELDEGLKQAVAVANGVRNQVFWPPTTRRGFDAYDWVLGLNEEVDLSEGEEEEVHER